MKFPIQLFFTNKLPFINECIWYDKISKNIKHFFVNCRRLHRSKKYVYKGEKKHYLPFFLHLCGHRTTSIIIVYINLQSSSSSSSTNYKPKFGSWMMFELSFVSFVCLQEAIPWWHFRSNWNTYSQTPKMTHQVDFGKPEILDLCGHYHL